ncbi:MAG: hypothetical protein COB04_18590 [Gammaproteobacteria bacterium]|nr:MAG: hypothetical protein COB04_18590 [Gammaproteobacteria bacterium]
MAGHPALNQIKTESSILDFSGLRYKISLSFHQIDGLSGHAVGIKFSDAKDSMDSSKKVPVNGMQLGKALGKRIVEMAGNLDNISFLGFYLLTDDIEQTRGRLAVRAKTRLYKAQAVQIHKNVSHKLPQLTQVNVDGGVAWGMGENNFISKPQFQLFISELSKETEVIDHVN